MKRALGGLERRYHEAGWIDASIAAPRATYDDQRGEVTVVVPIHAGPRYRIGHVIASGAGPATRAAVVEALGLRGGDWYNAPRVRVGIGRARRTTDRRVELRFDIAADRRSVDLEAHVK
jgi:outer membrane protein assembly factor BamA